MTGISFVLKVVFYRSEAGNEPVREWLKDLHLSRLSTYKRGSK